MAADHLDQIEAVQGMRNMGELTLAYHGALMEGEQLTREEAIFLTGKWVEGVCQRKDDPDA